GAGVHPDLLRRPRGTTVVSFRLILRASRVPGYEPGPQAPHSGSASGSSRETPLGEPEHKSSEFCFCLCQEMFSSTSKIFGRPSRRPRCARASQDEGLECGKARRTPYISVLYPHHAALILSGATQAARVSKNSRTERAALFEPKICHLATQGIAKRSPTNR